MISFSGKIPGMSAALLGLPRVCAPEAIAIAKYISPGDREVVELKVATKARTINVIPCAAARIILRSVRSARVPAQRVEGS